MGRIREADGPRPNSQECFSMRLLPLSTTKLVSAVLAGAALSAAAPSAMAAVIVYSGPPINIPNDIDGLYLNVVTGANGGSAPAGWDVNIYNNNSGLTFFSRSGDAASAYVGAANAASVLTVGTIVGPASSFTVNNPLGGGISGESFQKEGDRFFGFRFTSEGTSTVHYGYALLRSGADVGFPAQLLSYAFESTPNTAITVVPEPGTYAMLLAGLGVVGTLAAWRLPAAPKR
jgi:hypothetical protein